MSEWYKSSFWRNLVDMHIPDWNPEFLSRFDPRHYADMMETAHVDTAIIYAGSCLGICYWPTKAGHMHNGIKGRDIFGETAACCKQKGMNVIGYFNIWSRWAYDNYPEWRMQNAEGYFSVWEYTRESPGRYRVCCMNSPGFREYIKQQVSDLAGSYDLEGIWIDMIGWNGTVCYCHNCRSRYKEETGCEIPETVDWNSPEWVSFVRARERWFIDFQQMVKDAIQEVKPDITVAFQCASWTLGWGSGCSEELLDIGDYLAGDFYSDAVAQSVVCKTLAALTRNKPIEFMTSRCTNLNYHTTTKSEHELERAVSSAFAHNAAFVFIDAVDPAGTICDKLYAMMGSIYKRLEPVRRAINPDAELLADVGIYTNMLSAFDPVFNNKLIKDSKTAVNILNGVKKTGGLLIKNHVPYKVITPSNLEECSNLQVMILPDIKVLTEHEAQYITDFVNNGGSLLVTGDTGLWDECGNRLEDFKLSHLTGAHFTGITNEDITYMSPVGDGNIYMPENDERYPVQVSHTQNIVKIENDVEVLAELAIPYSRSDEINYFGSAISNPPGIWTKHPSIIRRNAGKGKVVYIAAPLENDENHPQQALFCDMIRSLAYKPLIVSTDAPDWLEVITYYDRDRNVMQVSFVNSMQENYKVSAYGINISIKVPGTVTAIKDILKDNEIKFSQSGDDVSFKLDEVSDFTMLNLVLDKSDA